jgi:hypothetical protein
MPGIQPAIAPSAVARVPAKNRRRSKSRTTNIAKENLAHAAGTHKPLTARRLRLYVLNSRVDAAPVATCGRCAHIARPLRTTA